MDELNTLLRDAQEGDLDATGELLERFGGMATGYAWKLNKRKPTLQNLNRNIKETRTSVNAV